MKPILIIKEKNENGKYEFTKEEIEEIIDQSYNEGVSDGKAQSQPIYINPSPYTPSPYTYPNDEWWKKQVWCSGLTESHSTPNPNIRATNATSFFQSVPGSEGAV